MATVNRESYTAAAQKLTAETRTATAAQLATVADEILSVAGLLRAQPRLRRALPHGTELHGTGHTRPCGISLTILPWRFQLERSKRPKTRYRSVPSS